jgi:GNAT superfamily N-acetyltransferase
MIRPADERDIPALLRMGHYFFDEAGWGDVASYDPASMAETMRGLIARPDGIFLVAEIDGQLVGMAAALLHPHYFNSSILTGVELFWWVSHEHRKGVGAELLEALEGGARAAGAISFTMISVVGLRSDALDRVYRRRGYRPAERTYIRML